MIARRTCKLSLTIIKKKCASVVLEKLSLHRLNKIMEKPKPKEKNNLNCAARKLIPVPFGLLIVSVLPHVIFCADTKINWSVRLPGKFLETCVVIKENQRAINRQWYTRYTRFKFGFYLCLYLVIATAYANLLHVMSDFPIFGFL